MKKDRMSFERVLLVRNDRIGDLVLTTPVLCALHESLPNAKISVLVAAGNLDLVKENPYVHEILVDDYDKSLHGFFDLVRDLKKHDFQAAVLAVPSFRMACALFFARIPVRAGAGTHLYCHALLSNVKNQHRSKGDRHETEYSLDLLSCLGISPSADLQTYLRPSDANLAWIDGKIASLGLKKDHRKLVIIHPGMGGSALNWKTEKWTELITLLSANPQLDLVITGSNADRNLIQEIVAAARAPVLSLAGQTTLGWLMALCARANAFIGPSTGPTHIAAALGTLTFALFPPVHVQNAGRWGPWKAKRTRVFSPPVDCPARYRCLGEQCRSYYCMDMIYPEIICKKLLMALGLALPV